MTTNSLNSPRPDLLEELHKTVVQSLTTTFGLDFMLLEDKVGGNVDTTHNVRQGIHATQKEKDAYDNRGDYNSTDYHSHKNYIDKNREGKHLKEQGQLKDGYSGKTFNKNDKINLDHIISAKEVHDDPARSLAGLDGTDLANHSSNLVHTSEGLNKSKQAKPMDEFIKTHRERTLVREAEINTLKSKPSLTPKESKRLKSLEDQNAADYKKMEEYDEKARKRYNAEIDRHYYTSSKFIKNVATTSVSTGFKMGTRQALGLVLAEVWFELKSSIPAMIRNHRTHFELSAFLNDLQSTFQAIIERVKKRFSELLTSFKDGFLGGIIANVTTTLVNILSTTTRLFGKLIREVGVSLIKVLKLIFFNPQHLAIGDLAREAFKILSAAVGVSAGVYINQLLAPIFSFPFGPALAAFAGALSTGLITLGLHYFLDYSDSMQKIWTFLNRFKSHGERELEYYKNVNAELDRYLLELGKIEFNLDAEALHEFNNELSLANSEIERLYAIQGIINERNISLPYTLGDSSSVRNWLNNINHE